MGQIVKLHGYEAEIFERYATIADVQVWSETHVGSRTHFSPNATPSTSVYSNVANKSRVFIAFDDGREEVREINDQYPMRPGHRVLYRYLTFQGETKQVFFRNLNTGNTWWADKMIEMPRVHVRRIFPTRVFLWITPLCSCPSPDLSQGHCGKIPQNRASSGDSFFRLFSGPPFSPDWSLLALRWYFDRQLRKRRLPSGKPIDLRQRSSKLRRLNTGIVVKCLPVVD